MLTCEAAAELCRVCELLEGQVETGPNNVHCVGYKAYDVVVPENGQMAINAPLSAARRGACSTRSVHPTTMAMLTRIINTIGGPIRLNNPYLTLTKAQVCSRAIEYGLDADILMQTVSCGRSPYVLGRGEELHCGCCYPCLVRRAALLAGVGRDDTTYRYEFWNLPEGDPKADDARALSTWLSRPFTLANVIADVPLDGALSAAAVLNMLSTARVELTSMLDSLIPKEHPLRAHFVPG